MGGSRAKIRRSSHNETFAVETEGERETEREGEAKGKGEAKRKGKVKSQEGRVKAGIFSSQKARTLSSKAKRVSKARAKKRKEASSIP